MSNRVDEVLRSAVEQLQTHLTTSSTARLDAELLLCHAVQKGRSFLFTWPGHELTRAQASQFQALLRHRLKGTPVAYLTGERDFWSLKLSVSPSVLIPRPDTELLVELALARELPSNARVADLGTGTGAIALALGHEKPQWTLFAVEKSPGALEIAQYNAAQNQLSNVHCLLGDWCSPLPNEPLDMIVSNPPYVRDDDLHLKQGDVRFEPLTALASGPDGLDDIRLIVSQANHHLKIGGWLLIEHGYDQGESVRELMSASGFLSVETFKDLGGHDRVSQGRKSS